MQTKMINKYDYNKALDRLRKEYHEVQANYRIPQTLRDDILLILHDTLGNWINYEDQIPLTDLQQNIVRDNQ